MADPVDAVVAAFPDCATCGDTVGDKEDVMGERMPVVEPCPTCEGKGTVVKNGPSEWEYDNLYPCPTCTADRAALRGTGVKPDVR